MAVRQHLPVFQFRRSVLETVAKASVVVVAGETGSGKSTQVPQFILEVSVVVMMMMMMVMVMVVMVMVVMVMVVVVVVVVVVMMIQLKF